MNLKEKYLKQVIPALQKELNQSNIHALPEIKKVVLNVGLGANSKEDQYVANVEKTLQAITGQKPVPTKARQSIAGFKVREGQIVGLKVTLQGRRMYEFVDKLVNVALPRVRDFRGLNPKSIDRQGNMTIGFREHLAFPEINPDAVDTIHGLEVIIKTSAQNQKESKALFELLGFPFKK